MKKFLSMLLTIILLSAVLIPLAAAGEEEISPEAGYYYVYTENGKALNVRDQPGFGGNKVGELKYGTRIHVDAFTDENWALIVYEYDKPGYGVGQYAAWVNRRFLTTSKPASKSSGSSSGTASGDFLTEINRQFRSAKQVDEYTITVRPTRVTGWVNLRWAPSKSAELMATYRANDQLIVMSEMTDWLQVRDPDTGNVGFLNKVFVAE